MAVQLIGKDGSVAEVNLSLELYKEAADRKLTFRQLVNQKFPTTAEAPETFKQMCARAGIRFKKDQETGQEASTLREMLDPISYDAANKTGGTYTSSPMIPDSRLLFPAAIMEAVENKLQGRQGEVTSALDSVIGMTMTIPGKRLEQPVMAYGGKQGPEDSKFQRIAQNSRPAIMLSLTASDISRVIPVSSVGLEISDDAMATPLDFVSLTLARFLQMTDYNERISQFGLLLAGDPDAAVTPMSAGTSALAQTKANTFDATIVANGVVTQTAWLKFLHRNSLTNAKTHVIMDFSTALALDNRAGRPTNVMNNGTDRIDTPINMIFPTFGGGGIQAIVFPDGTIPTNTIWALNKDYAIAKVISSSASYSATEALVMKKSQEWRFDRGSLCYRFYDTAHEVLSLTI